MIGGGKPQKERENSADGNGAGRQPGARDVGSTIEGVGGDVLKNKK